MSIGGWCELPSIPVPQFGTTCLPTVPLFGLGSMRTVVVGNVEHTGKVLYQEISDTMSSGSILPVGQINEHGSD